MIHIKRLAIGLSVITAIAAIASLFIYALSQTPRWLLVGVVLVVVAYAVGKEW